MRDGVLQQVGTPEHACSTANIFVAGFIGSPAMNFVPPAEESTCASGQRPAPGKAAEVVAGLDNGTELSVGFRPEHLELGEGAPADAIRIPARAEVVEFLGDEELIHARADGGGSWPSSARIIACGQATIEFWLALPTICSTRRASWRCPLAVLDHWLTFGRLAQAGGKRLPTRHHGRPRGMSGPGVRRARTVENGANIVGASATLLPGSRSRPPRRTEREVPCQEANSLPLWSFCPCWRYAPAERQWLTC